MNTSMLIASCLGLSLAVGAGCSEQERVQRHEEAAHDKVVSAHQELAEGQRNASDEIAKANDRARDDLRAAREEREKAASAARPLDTRPIEARRLDENGRLARLDESRVPVAGHYDNLLESKLRDKFGDDWAISRHPDGLVMNRRVIKPVDKHFHTKINEKIASLRDDKDRRGLSARATGSDVRMSGRLEDCGDALKSVDDFAGVDGVNHVLVDMSCNK